MITKPTKTHNLYDHFVYFNLQKRCWSLRAEQSHYAHVSGRSVRDDGGRGRVTCHADTVLLSGCTFKVSEAGRQRVIREQRKNVHAGIVCELATVNPALPFVVSDKTPQLRYNPYESGHFRDVVSGRALDYSAYILLQSGRVYYSGELYSTRTSNFLAFSDFQDSQESRRHSFAPATFYLQPKAPAL